MHDFDIEPLGQASSRQSKDTDSHEGKEQETQVARSSQGLSWAETSLPVEGGRINEHVAMFNCKKGFNPSPTGRTVFQLQRRYGNQYVQQVVALARKADSSCEVSPEVEQAVHRARGSGHPLDTVVQSKMEPAFGVNFSAVRVHANSEADTLSRALNAQAFTVGQDIFFRQDKYSPGSSTGRELIAHELTHVVQQGGARMKYKLSVSTPGDRYEQEADQMAKTIMQQEQQTAQHQSNEVSRKLIHRQTEEEEESVQAKSESYSIQRQVEEEEETSS